MKLFSLLLALVLFTSAQAAAPTIAPRPPGLANKPLPPGLAGKPLPPAFVGGVRSASAPVSGAGLPVILMGAAYLIHRRRRRP